MPHPTGRPWIVAHRGASLQARDNTIEAFLLAAQMGADAVELDVRRTADSALVVHHDDTIHGEERPIVAMTRAEVAEAASWIPDLSSAIEACNGMWVDIEIKNDPREADWDPSDRVAAQIAEEHRDDDIIVTSFNPASVKVANRAGLRTGLLLGWGFDPAEMAPVAATAGHEFLLPHWAQLKGEDGPRIAHAAKQAGVELAVWTVDDPHEMSRLAGLGVGAVCTNTPDVALSALAEHGDG